MKSESTVQSEVMIKVSQLGHRIWRNNVGVAVDKSGRHIRYGLCNSSTQLNSRLKSSDLIGIHGVTGQLISIECKREGWKYTGSEREIAQLRWIELIIQMGGIAGFISDVSQVEELLR